jgi:hypothetical protein
MNTRLEAQLEEARTTIESLTSEKSKHAKLIKQHQADVDNIKLQHSVEMEAIKGSVNRKVTQALSSIGVNQFVAETIYSDKAQATDQELLIQLNSLPQEQKTEFYQKHKVQLSRAVLAKT